ncbi:MAG: hypothetical protein B6D41_03060 [Chloroflexi bacterium UTCFX4]|jgi:hypothetical protein|nr:MAG: hypothetical protein B6D41_03060 [Chloroflexi bacterium UTCFX4]
METPQRKELTREEIAEIVHGIPSIDWERMRYLASLTNTERILEGMRDSEKARAIKCEEFALQFPNETRGEINMRVLQHFTSVRMD